MMRFLELCRRLGTPTVVVLLVVIGTFSPAQTNLPNKPTPGAPANQPAPLGYPQMPPIAQPQAGNQPSSPAKSTGIIPASAERHFREAAANERDGDPEGAISEYRSAIKDYPDYADAHYNLGRLLIDKQGYSEAIKELKEAIRLKPNDADAHNNLGLALKRNGDVDAAAAQYREAIRLNPKLATAHNNLGNLLYAKRDFGGAIEQYRAALALMPKSAQTHMNLGSVLDDSGRSDEAIAEYKQALILDPKNANIHYNLSIVYQKKHDLPAAVAELKQAAQLSPDWPQPHIMLFSMLKDSDPQTAYRECVVADGLTHDAKLHDRCLELQKKAE